MNFVDTSNLIMKALNPKLKPHFSTYRCLAISMLLSDKSSYPIVPVTFTTLWLLMGNIESIA